MTDNMAKSLKRKRNDVHYRMSAHQLYDSFEKCIYIAGDNEIHFNCDVSDKSITRIKRLFSIIIDENKDKLIKYDKDGKNPDSKREPFIITYIINSPGGCVSSLTDFVDYINYLRCTYANIKFTSIITGTAASCGTLMAVIADKKLMTRFAFAMIHELSTGLARTSYTKVITHSEFIKDLHDVLVTIYQEGRGIDPADKEKRRELENLLNRETWMTAEQYKSNGFIDEIIANHTLKLKN